MKGLKFIAGALCIAMLSTGCGSMNNKTKGGLIGAAGGGALGSGLGAAIGALANGKKGAKIGAAIGAGVGVEKHAITSYTIVDEFEWQIFKFGMIEFGKMVRQWCRESVGNIIQRNDKCR